MDVLRRLRPVALLVACHLAATPTLAAQDREEILSFDVVVDIQPDGRLEVVETITVRALGNDIRRGIYRDFPTSFPRSSGLGRIEAPFDVHEVLRDGNREPYRVESIGGGIGRGGVRVRIGDPDTFLSTGVHRYTLRYTTERWLTFGESEDALYWNVTGNGWDFPIQSASARVVLPGDVDPATLGFEAWTGPEGSTDTAAEWGWSDGDGEGGAARFSTTAPLGAREGLTIRLTFPTGRVAPPTPTQEAEWAMLDWGGYIDAALALALVVGLYLFMWNRVGRDPERGPVVVQYEPPSGFSPAALGFLDERGFDHRIFSATLVSLAVNGAVRLEKDGRKWRLHRAGDLPADVPPEEKGLYRDVLKRAKSLDLTQSHHARLRKASKALTKTLSARLEKHYFVLNRGWFAVGAVGTLVVFAALVYRARFSIAPEGWFLGFWLTFWTAGVSTLVYRAGRALAQGIRTGGIGNWFEAIFLSLFSLPFLAAELVVGAIFVAAVPTHLVLAAVTLGVVNVLFYHLLERPTLKGQGVLRHLEGFKAFLKATEEDRLQRLLPKDRTPELFERYLPYAIALGLENAWARGFEDVLARSATPAGTAAGSGGASFSWYAGSTSVGDLSGMASSLGGSLSSSLSSASSPPSSSGGGGGGGGGSSGGGGGGGGGGGW